VVCRAEQAAGVLIEKTIRDHYFFKTGVAKEVEGGDELLQTDPNIRKKT